MTVQATEGIVGAVEEKALERLQIALKDMQKGITKLATRRMKEELEKQLKEPEIVVAAIAREIERDFNRGRER